MRSDIKPGGVFPDYSLPDHTNTVRKLSEIQGDDPLILTLAGATTARRSTSSTSSWRRTIRRSPSSYTQVATIATDDHHTSRSSGLRSAPNGPSCRTPAGRSSRTSTSQEYTDPEHNPMIPHTFVLKPGLVIHTVYNGYWFWGRPSFDELWLDLRAASGEIRPDWDLSKPGLREAWDKGDYSSFHGWDRKKGSVPTSYDECVASSGFVFVEGQVSQWCERRSARLLGIEQPIVQAPMSAVPGLAAAVSNAGALGMLALTWSDSGRRPGA